MSGIREDTSTQWGSEVYLFPFYPNQGKKFIKYHVSIPVYTL